MYGLRYDTGSLPAMPIRLGAYEAIFGKEKSMQVIAVTGGKGGVGKTNIAVNLGVSMSREGLDVLLLDADLGLANVDVILGMSVGPTLADVVEGTHQLNDVIVEGPEGLRIVPASSGVARLATLDQSEQNDLVRSFSEQIEAPDVLIVDTGAGIDTTVQTFVSACKTVVVVVCDEPASLTDAYALMKVMRNDRGVRRFEVLANQIDSPARGRQVYDRLTTVADKYLDVELGYLGGIPSDAYLRRAVQERVALVSKYPRSPAAVAIRDAGRRLTKDIYEGEVPGMGFFVEQLLRPPSASRH